MALSLLRRQRIAPMPLEAERAPRQPLNPTRRDDDYLIDGDDRDDRPTVAARVVNTAQILLIIVMAILAPAIAWLLGVMFNIL
jgi:hypothetical protein